MATFSHKDLKPRHAILSGAPGDATITILLRPFLREGEIVDTSIRLEGIDLPSNLLRDLAGKAFEFPVNPDDGYIDGSIYLESAHHPVDVTSLNFSASRDGQLTLVVKGAYVFDFEGLDGLGRVPFTLAAAISSCVV